MGSPVVFVGPKWRGTWLIGTIYNVNDLVVYTSGGVTSAYIGLIGNVGQTPSGGAPYWQLFAQGGTSGAGYLATSSSSVTVGTGSLSFTTQAGLAYSVGARARATSIGSGAYVEGVVTSYSGTTLVINSDTTAGSGTHTDWDINIAGGPAATFIPQVPYYNFTPVAPGGSLSVGSNTFSLSVSGLAAGAYLYISAGTGTAEAVPITAVGSGTVTVTCAHTHSGAWTIQSATAGINEAINANPFRRVYAPAGHYVCYGSVVLNPAQSLILFGDTPDPAGVHGTFFDFSAVTINTPAFTSTGSGNISVIELSDFLMVGTNSSSGGDGIYLNNAVRVILSNLEISGFTGHGVHMVGAFEVTIERKCNISYNGGYGVLAANIANLLRIVDSYINFNVCETSGLANIGVLSTSVSSSTTVTLDNVDCENAGTSPFAGATITSALAAVFDGTSSLFVKGCYFEIGVGTVLVSYAPTYTITSLIEIGNWFMGGTVNYSATVTGIKSFGNTFHGSGTYRIFAASSPTTYDVGPDTAQASSPEVTNNPRLLGVGPLAAQQAVSSSNLTLTTSFQDIVGATITLNRAGLYMITGTIQFVDASDVGQIMIGALVINGSFSTTPNDIVWTPGTTGASATASQTYLATISSIGQIVKLQARKFGGSGTSYAASGNCSLTAVWVPQ